MKVVIDGTTTLTGIAVTMSEQFIHVHYEPGPTRVPPKSEMVRWTESVTITRDDVHQAAP
jgi:hypothetical protein